jgi:putative tryptophan/tyrosine transport system substrate-binding protein
MRRREFITLVGSAAATWPLAARAQQPDRMRLIGVLMPYAEGDTYAQSLVAAFRAALATLGWMDGSSLRIELRWGAGDEDRFKSFAEELVDLRPDALLGVSTLATDALAKQTQTIPIVFAIVADPIRRGFAVSLSRPGRNITGFTEVESTLGGKWVELLKEIAPSTARVALLFNPTTAPPLQIYLSSIQAAAPSFRIEVSTAPVHGKDEIEGVIAEQARNPGGGLIVMPDLSNMSNRDLIISLAARYGVPAIYFTRLIAESGGLIAYGTDFVELVRQAAGYIDRILKGAKPADLPIQLPSKFDLVINLKTAKTLGLTIPRTLLATADEVIE